MLCSGYVINILLFFLFNSLAFADIDTSIDFVTFARQYKRLLQRSKRAPIDPPLLPTDAGRCYISKISQRKICFPDFEGIDDTCVRLTRRSRPPHVENAQIHSMAFVPADQYRSLVRTYYRRKLGKKMPVGLKMPTKDLMFIQYKCVAGYEFLDEARYMFCYNNTWLETEPVCTLKNPCEIENGGCSHECIQNGTEFYCACPDGMLLDETLTNCIVEPMTECKTIKGCTCKEVDETQYVCQCKNDKNCLFIFPENRCTNLKECECERIGNDNRHRCLCRNEMKCLLIAGIPQVFLPPGPFLVEPGGSLNVTCSAVGYPFPNITWLRLKGERRMKQENGNDEYNGVHNKHLVIKNLFKSDTFECVAANIHGQVSKQFQVTVTGPGSAPVIITSESKSTSIELFWKAPKLITRPVVGYLIYYTKDSSKPLTQWQSVKATDKQNILLEGLESDTKYYFRIRAYDKLGLGLLSAIFSVSTKPPASAPRLIILQGSEVQVRPGGSVNVTCSVIGGYPPPAIAWIEVGVDWTAMVVPWALISLDKIFKNKKLFCFATNEAGNITKSIDIVVTGPGSPPLNVQYAIVDGVNIRASWSKPKVTNGNIISYTIYYTTDSTLPVNDWNLVVVSDGSTDYLIENLDSNTVYYLRIRANNDLGPGPLSPLDEIKTASALSAPEIHVIQGSQVMIKPSGFLNLTCVVTFGNPPPNVDWYKDGEKLLFMDGKPVVDIESVTLDHRLLSAATLTIGDVRESGLYECVAVNKVAETRQSVEIIVTGPGTSPLNVSALVDGIRVVLKWEPPKMPNGPIKAYEILYTIDDSKPIDLWQISEVEGDVLRAEILGLEQNSIYTFIIRAVNDYGPGLASKQMLIQTGKITVAPRVTIVEGELIQVLPGESVLLTCKVVAGNPLPKIGWYKDDEPMGTDLVETSEAILELTEVFESVTYACLAENEVDKGDAQVEIVVMGPGSPPSHIEVGLKNGVDVELVWSEPKYPNGKIKSYVIYYSLDGSLPLDDWQKIVISDGSMSAMIGGLNERTTYYFKMQAVNEHGPGVVSEEFAVETSTKPKEQKAPNIVVEEGSVVYVKPRGQVNLTCSLVEGYPSPKLGWLHDGKPVGPSAMIVASTTLRLEQVIESKEYECVAKNELGEYNFVVQVIVTGPGLPPDQIRVLIFMGDTIDAHVSWLPPKIINGQVQSYNIYYSTNATADFRSWTKITVDGDGVMETTIEGLEPDTDYYFKMNAISERGIGVLSDLIEIDTRKCNHKQYRCPEGTCIPLSWVCDNDVDCFNGAEEINCPEVRKCDIDHYRCPNDLCIPSHWVCDGASDCVNGTDELNCTGLRKCGLKQHRCPEGACIPYDWVCDGADDCLNGTEEVMCQNFTRPCTDTEHRCAGDGKCVPVRYVCDGDVDCVNGTDEFNCTPGSLICGPNEYKCLQDGNCIPSSWVCDSHPDCLSGSDEANCPDKAPKVVLEQGEIVYVKPQGALNLTCGVIEGSPHPTLVWFHQGKPVGPESVVVNRATLELKHIIESTDYECMAQNEVGQHSAIVQLIVTGPGTPPEQITIHIRNGVDAFVSWLPPKISNGQIQSYNIFYSTDDTAHLDKWFKVSVDGIGFTEKTIENLDPNAKYYFRMNAISERGAGVMSDIFDATTGSQKVLPQVTILEGDEVRVKPGEDVDLTCEVIAGHPSPSLAWYKDDDLYSEPIVVKQLQTTFNTFTSTTYKCVGENEVGTNMATVQVIVIGPGSAPLNVRVVNIGEDFIAVGWEEPDITNGEIEAYEILYSTDESFPYDSWNTFSVSENALNANVGNLEPNTEYFFVIRAINKDGPGIESEQIQFLTRPKSSLPVVTILEGDEIEIRPGGSVELTCQLVSGHPLPTLGWFENDVAINGQPFIVGEVLTRHSPLYTSRTFECIAENQVGKGAASIEVIVTGPGSPPTDIEAVVDGTSVQIEWNEPQIPNGFIELYEVYYTFDRTLPLDEWNKVVVTDGSLQTTIDQLEPSAPYYFQIRAINVRGPGIMSSTFELMTGLEDVAPEIEIIEGNELEVDPGGTIAMTCNVLIGHPPPKLAWLSNGEVKSVSDVFKTLELTVDGIVESAEYTCTATNEIGEASAIVNVIVKGPGSPPRNIAYVLDRTTITFSWEPPTIINGQIQTYELYYTDDPSLPLDQWKVEVIDGDLMETVVSDLSEGTQYNFQIVALNENGKGIPSPTLEIVTGFNEQKPEIEIVEGEEVRVEPDSTLTVTCNVIGGYPTPTVAWYVDGEAVETPFKAETVVMVKEHVRQSSKVMCKAENSAGTVEKIVDVIVTGPGSPPQETTYKIDGVDIDISWTEPEITNGLITKYEIFYTTDESLSISEWSKLIVNGDEQNAVIKDLLPTTIYHFKIRALNELGAGPFTQTAHLETLQEAKMPKIEVVEGNEVFIEPGAALELSCKVIEGYPAPNVGWYQTDGPINEPEISILSTLKKENMYRSSQFTCKADNSVGTTEQIVDVIVTGPGSPPTDIEAAVDGISVQIEWSEPQIPNGVIESYEVYYTLDRTLPLDKWNKIVVTDGSLQTTIDQLEPSAHYYLQIRAINDRGPGIMSSSFEVVTGLEDVVPEIEIIEGNELEVEPGGTITMTCNVVIGHPPPILTWLTKGEVKRSPDVSKTFELTVDGIVESAEYECTATNKIGQTSAIVNVIVKGPGSPPTDIEAAVDGISVQIEWSEPQIPNGVIESYEVYYTLDGTLPLDEWNKVVVTDGSLQTRIDQLEPSAPYYFQIRAINDRGPGIMSSTFELMTGLEDVAPEIEIIEGNELEVDPGGTITMTCNVLIGHPPPKLTWLTKGEVKSSPDVSKTFELTVDGIVESAEYECTATNEIGQASAIVNVIVKGPGSAPRNIAYMIDQTTITFSWEPPTITNGQIQSYELYYTDDPSLPLDQWKVETVDGDLMETVISDLSEGTRYNFQIVALNENGKGIPSPTLEIVTGFNEQKPEIEIVEGEEVRVEPDSTLTVTCNVIGGYPTPAVAWYVDGEAVETPLNAETVLMVKDHVRQSSKVVCKAENSAGTVEKIVDIIVTGPGSPPQETTYKVDGIDIDISWTEPEITNGLITKYEIFYTTDESLPLSEWSKLVVNGDEDSAVIEDLLPRTVYHLKIRALNEFGAGLFTRTAHLETLQEAMIPKIEVVEGTEVFIEPGAALELSCKVIEGYPAPHVGWYQTDGPIKEPEISILSTLNKENMYRSSQFTCKADNSVGTTEQIVDVIVTGPGSAPSPLTVEVDGVDVDVSWEEPEITNGLIIGYEIFYTSDSTLPFDDWSKLSVGGAERNARLENLLPITIYFIKARALNVLGPGPFTNTYQFETWLKRIIPLVRISHESRVEFEPKDESLSINCTAEGVPRPEIIWFVAGQPAVDGDGLRIYDVTELSSVNKTQSILILDSTLKWTNVTCKGRNTVGENERTVDLVVTGPGSPPQNVDVVVEENTLIISWSPPLITNGEISGYQIKYTTAADPNEDDWLTIDVTEDEFETTISDLTSRTTYWIKIAAQTQLGDGIYSEQIEVITKIKRLKPMVTINSNLISASDPDLIILSPGDPLNFICYVSGYPKLEIQAYYNEQLLSLTSSPVDEVLHSIQYENDTWKVEFFGVDHAYQSGIITCKAENEMGTAEASKNVAIRGPGAPPSNIDVVVTPINEVTVTWDKPEIHNDPITGYILYMSGDPGKDIEFWTSIRIQDPTQVGYVFKSGELDPESTYYIRMRAVNEKGDGPLSEAIEFSTFSGGPGSPPRDVNFDIELDNTVTLRWLPPLEPNGEIIAYTIYFTADDSDKGSKFWDKTGPTTAEPSFVLSNLKPHTIYYVRISATNKFAEGPLSEMTIFETGKGAFAPELTITPEGRVEVEPGTVNFTITCTAIGIPKPSRPEWKFSAPPDFSDLVGYSPTEQPTDQSATTAFLASVKQSTNISCESSNSMGKDVKWVHVVVLGPGTPVEDVRIEPDENSLKIFWSDPAFPNGMIAAYTIHFTADPSLSLDKWKSETIGGDVKQLLLGGLLEETTYYIRIRPVGELGEGLLSSVFEGTTELKRRLPKILEFLPEEDEIRVVAGESVVLICRVEGYPTPLLSWTWNGNHIDLPPDSQPFQMNKTMVESKLTLENVVENGVVTCSADREGITAAVSKAVSILGPGGPPEHFKLTLEPDNTVTITWMPPVITNGEITGYDIYLDDVEFEELSGDQRSFIIFASRLDKNRSYFLKIRAKTATGTGPFSEPQIFNTGSGVPSEPIDVVVSVAIDNTISVDWSNPIEPNGFISSYTIYYSPDPQPDEWSFVSIDVGAGRPIEITPDHFLTETKYYLKVTAKNENGQGHDSKIVHFVTGTGVVIPTVSLIPSDDPLEVSPRGVVKIECIADGIPAPLVEWMADGRMISGEEKLEMDLSDHKYSWLKTDFILECKASNSAGSDSRSVTVAIQGPSSPPLNVNLESHSPTEVTASWREPTYPNGDIVHYIIHYKSVSSDQWETAKTLGPTYLSMTVTGLNPDNQYEFRIQAESYRGPGVISEPLTIRTLHQGTAPVIVVPGGWGTIGQTTLQVLPGSTLEIYCNASGDPQPSISWIRGGNVAIDPSTMDHTQAAAKWALVLPDIRVDSTFYCIAENRLGYANWTLVINVKELDRGWEIGFIKAKLKKDETPIIQIEMAEQFRTANLTRVYYTEDGTQRLTDWHVVDVSNSSHLFQLQMPDMRLGYTYYMVIENIDQGIKSPMFTVLIPKPVTTAKISVDHSGSFVAQWQPPVVSETIESYLVQYSSDPSLPVLDWASVQGGPSSWQDSLLIPDLLPNTTYVISIDAVLESGEILPGRTFNITTQYVDLCKYSKCSHKCQIVIDDGLSKSECSCPFGFVLNDDLITCSALTTSTIDTTVDIESSGEEELTTVKPFCTYIDRPLDLLFVIDASNSIDKMELVILKGLLRIFVDTYLNLDKVNIGVIQYSNFVQSPILLADYSSKEELFSKVLYLKRLEGETLTALGLREAQRQFENRARGRHVPKVVLLVSDGLSSQSPKYDAQRLRESGVAILALAVASTYQGLQELNAIVGGDVERVITFESYVHISKRKTMLRVVDKLCQIVNETQLPTDVPPEWPAQVVHLEQVGKGTISVSWNVYVDPVPPNLDYLIYYTTNPSISRERWTFVQASCSDRTGKVIGGFTPDATVTVCVRARNTFGLGPFSNCKNITLTPEFTKTVTVIPGCRCECDNEGTSRLVDCASQPSSSATFPPVSTLSPVTDCSCIINAQNGRCPAGYLIRKNMCYDVNECVNGNGGCSDGCINTPGSFYCACPHDKIRDPRNPFRCIDHKDLYSRITDLISLYLWHNKPDNGQMSKDVTVDKRINGQYKATIRNGTTGITFEWSLPKLLKKLKLL